MPRAGLFRILRAMPFPLYLALAYLRPRRSFASAIPVITVLGVTLGVAILMIVLAVMTGFGDVWREKILSFKPHIVVAARTPDGVVADPEAVCRAAEAVPGVASACAGVFDPSGDRALVGRTLARRLWTGPGGRFLCYSPLNLRSADELYFPEELRISGVYDMKMAQFDDGMVVCSLGMARDLMGMDGGARLVQVQVAAPEFAHVQAAALAEALGPLYAVSTWQDEDAMLFNALRTEKMMMFILLAFIAVVAAFCVTNTLIVITIQKTREIGLMKALGFSAGQIRSAFVLSGLLQCVAGEALGYGLGWLVLHNLQRLVAWLSSMGIEVFPEAVYGLPEIPWRIVTTDVAAVLCTVFAFCFAASFLPAWLASRLDPVKAINQE